MRQEFENGSVLLTGNDMIAAMEKDLNCRDNYDVSCSFCEHEGNDEHCDGCTILDTDYSCSCHINPPCSKCVGSKFEVTPYLINYEHIVIVKSSSNISKKRWIKECFKGDKDVFEKLEAIESLPALKLTAESLSTGEIAMYIEDGIERDYEIEICRKPDFKQTMRKMIMGFDLNTSTTVTMEPPEENNNEHDTSRHIRG